MIMIPHRNHKKPYKSQPEKKKAKRKVTGGNIKNNEPQDTKNV